MKCVWILRQVINFLKKARNSHEPRQIEADKLHTCYAILAEIMILCVVRMLFMVKQ